MKEKTKKMTMTAMLIAIAFLMVVMIHIKVGFLSYEPKDVVITIGGFLFGPLTACCISVIVSFIEFLTISDTELWGLLMNILASISFCGTASYIYKKKHTMKGAILGLGAGIVTMTAMMLLWNYLVTPFYMGVPRAQVAGMLTTLFLPFNLIKASLNAALTLVLYKPVVTALRKTGLLAPDAHQGGGKPKFNVGMMIAAGIVAVTCVLLFLVMNGVI